ncbi:glycoside hydrolase family 43 protein [Shimia sp.]|uniref:glycoside hydrolase family 43 protein n=1 Tax=Shimia sp. TaxID=1954381 RepID=UPI003B8AC3AB
MVHIKNPILRGFHPDPSICRVGEDYYIATSTFEWYPGVQISHSRDLVHWRTVGQALNRQAQLDMRGNPDSGGVWAPSLSFADGQFWLIYSDVKRLDGNFKDAHNYLVTAPTIEGPWSDPIYLNSSGFDPSLFHDDNGKKYLVNMVWNHLASMGNDHVRGAKFFGGILLQEYDVLSEKLVGNIQNIFPGSELGLVEAPHLFQRGDYYYLITAEGGTGYEHAVTYARSRDISGPYELHPNTFLLTAQNAPEGALQRAGHGQYVELPDGTPYHTFLCSRPLPGMKRSPMGRETGIARCCWGEDDWLYLDHQKLEPATNVTPPELPSHPWPDPPVVFDFKSMSVLPPQLQWLRSPETERLFELRQEGLRLFGRESIGSLFEQSLVAARQTEWVCEAQTCVDFDPEDFQQLAGLTAYYNRTQFHYLALTRDPKTQGRGLVILSCADWPEARVSYPMADMVAVPEQGPVWLKLNIDHAALQFAYSLDGLSFEPIGPVLDASILSDEGVRGEHSNFTGNFIGMAAQDVTGRARSADFAMFKLDQKSADV